MVAGRVVLAAPGHARPALRQLVLRGPQGAPPARRVGAGVPSPTPTPPACARAPAGCACRCRPSTSSTELVGLAVAANARPHAGAPGALYLRPTLLGTDVTIGAPRRRAPRRVLYVLACPVGDYLPPRPLTVAVETATPRHDPAVRRRQDGRQLRDGADADRGRPRALRRRPGPVRAGRHRAGDRRLERAAHRRRGDPHAGADRRLPPRRHPRLAAAAGPRRSAGPSRSARSPSTTASSGSPGPAPSSPSPARRRSSRPSARSSSTASPTPSAHRRGSAHGRAAGRPARHPGRARPRAPW